LAAVSIAQSFQLKLDSDLDDLFQQELRRMEQEKSSSTEWSQMFRHSEENLFMAAILRWGYKLPRLQQLYPYLLAKALERSPERVARAVSEWKAFVDECYLSKDRAVPDYPEFIEIQEAIRKYGRSKFVGMLHAAQKDVKVFLKRVSSWIWKKHMALRRIGHQNAR
jgi:hypothetical protein